jgi:hypothetical protein
MKIYNPLIVMLAFFVISCGESSNKQNTQTSQDLTKPQDRPVIFTSYIESTMLPTFPKPNRTLGFWQENESNVISIVKNKAFFTEASFMELCGKKCRKKGFDKISFHGSWKVEQPLTPDEWRYEIVNSWIVYSWLHKEFDLDLANIDVYDKTSGNFLSSTTYEEKKDKLTLHIQAPRINDLEAMKSFCIMIMGSPFEKYLEDNSKERCAKL